MDEAQKRLEERIGECQQARIATTDRLRPMLSEDGYRLVEHLMTLSREMGELHARYDACRVWGI